METMQVLSPIHVIHCILVLVDYINISQCVHNTTPFMLLNQSLFFLNIQLRSYI